MLQRTAVCLTLIAMGSLAHADNWPHWRGPHFNGSTTEKNLPTDWSRSKNLAWTAPLPGRSASTPVVFGDHVFVSSADPDKDSLDAICIDRKTGKRMWTKSVGKGISKDPRSTYAAPSPTTDGKLVYFFYGSGELVAFDFDGNQIWERNIEKEYGQFAFQWTFASSPLLYNDKLYLQVLQRDRPARGRGVPGATSYLLAMNPQTGEELWKVKRPSKAVMESLEAFSSPVPYEHDGRKQLLIIGGDCLTGHDPETGEELWRWGTWNPSRIPHWRLVPSPVAGNGIVLACAPKKDPIYALPTNKNGNLNDRNLAWVSRDQEAVSSDVPTPGFYDGDFFVLSDVRSSLSRVEPQSGKVKWSIELPGRGRSTQKFEASPLVADGKIYVMNFQGDVLIVNAEDGKIVNNIAMGSGGDNMTRSSIAASNGQLFIRTNEALYCVGK